MRGWTQAETVCLLKFGFAMVAVAVAAHLWLPEAFAGTVVTLVAVIGVAGFVLSTRRRTVAWLEFERGQQLAMHAIHTVLPLRAPLPSLTGWAATPRFVAEAVQLVSRVHGVVGQSRQPLVLECGSGCSTLIIGYALEMAGGGRIVSLDHEEEYAEQTRWQIGVHGLRAHAQVVYAPLKRQVVEGEAFVWYDLSKVDLSQPIDLLVVDGPPSATCPQARFPAFPLLCERLADEAFILVDDTTRPDEARALQRWAEASDGQLQVRFMPEGRGYAVGHFRRQRVRSPSVVEAAKVAS